MGQMAWAFTVRQMRLSDIKQVLEVERDAFPTLRPPTPFKREIKNKLSRYIVAVQEPFSGISTLEGPVSPQPTLPGDLPARVTSESHLNGGWHRWISDLRRLLSSRVGDDPASHDFIVGYLGLWFMVDDAHIVSVGVREPYRRLGVGELLVIRAIEIASERGARSLTLEVRVSNYVAQDLYLKYGFKKTGTRKRYYSDNQEDAYIMTTDSIDTEGYQREFQRLKTLHTRKWGEPLAAGG